MRTSPTRTYRLVDALRRRVGIGCQEGMSIVEVGVAMMVMSVAVTGVVGSMGSGMHLVGQAKQRSAATAVAQERLERVRNVPYSRVALYEAPVHSADPSSPDNRVTTDNTAYRVEDSAPELLVLDAGNGALKHIDDPVKVGTTEFNVFQYVTWHDDPAITGTQDYKRVISVVTWKFPVSAGSAHRVTVSTFVGAGDVAAAPAATATPTPPPATPAPEVTATPPAGEACGVMALMSSAGAEQGYTNSTTLQVQLTNAGQCSAVAAALSNDGTTFSQVSSHLPATVTWTIANTDGPHTVHARFTDAQNNLSGTTGAIVLDQTVPPVITNLQPASCSIQGTNRVLALTWDGNATSDANFLGYRVYRSIDATPFSALLTTGAQAANDTTSKSYTSVRYMVRAYDKAGNESGDSNVLSYSKNSC